MNKEFLEVKYKGQKISEVNYRVSISPKNKQGFDLNLNPGFQNDLSKCKNKFVITFWLNS